jgi:hypothetical protein
MFNAIYSFFAGEATIALKGAFSRFKILRMAK